ncbi:SH3 and multiple ankyrin repeat domains protein 3-like isoform X1 [Lates japonicus]|uniref:SH3 and multiple ankyrin repeat domains protein 3-like isoform X1 n=1 Tax=Lates japonicus TaxID=270547 RepID=A0AAD3MUU6_LATJO|nr:SH3 and multiple ankyrin repeat domains protein 3-like isoform X1 [Lates japonicus]
MPLRPAAGKHEPPSPPRQDQQQQQHHTHTLTHSHTHPYTHAANGSQGASTDSGSSREEDSGVPDPVGVPAFRPGAQRSHSARAPMEEPTGNTVVIRSGIPDLQQTDIGLGTTKPFSAWLWQSLDAGIWIEETLGVC